MVRETKKKIHTILNINDKNKLKLEPIKISIIYFVIGFVWILFSDEIVNELVINKHLLAVVSTYKGWLYIVVTSIILYGLTSKILKKVESVEERYKTLVNNSQNMIYSCDSNGVFTAINYKFSQITGITSSEILGKNIDEIISRGAFDKQWGNSVMKVISCGKTLYLENVRYKDEIYFVTLSPIFDIKNKVIGVTGTNNNVTEYKKNEQIIRKMAYYDALTSLPNRVLFYEKVKNGIDFSSENGTKLIILFLDMDKFKRVNDTLGHALGDELLKETAKRLQSCMRVNDIVARISGDEFAILFQDIKNVKDALPLINKILKVFCEYFYIGTSSIRITASIGVSVFPKDGRLTEDLIKCADTAMYKSKELGRNMYKFFDSTMKKELLRKFNIEVMLRKAIVQREFVLYYQPQFNAKTKKLRGFEALIRWHNPKLGILNPLEFLPIAMESGLISIIGEWVINEACSFCKKISDSYKSNLKIGINISPLELKQDNFSEMVIKAINKASVNPSYIELEVTEKTFIDNFDFALKVLNDLTLCGVKFALDNFGTGYSSLNYLKKLPIDVLKIDRSFIHEIDTLNPMNDFVESIISLVHKLDIEVLAEGVENKFQYEYLENANIDSMQGYYLEKPLTQEQAEKIIMQLE